MVFNLFTLASAFPEIGPPTEAPHNNSGSVVPMGCMASEVSCGGVPDGAFAFAARLVDVPHPVHRLADAAARPVEGRHAHVPGSLLPLAVCTAQRWDAAGSPLNKLRTQRCR